MENVVAELQGLAECRPLQQLSPHPLVLAAALAAPHFLYAYIWLRPREWVRLFPKNAVDAFATCGLVGKVVQFIAVLLYIAALRPTGLCLDPHAITLTQWLLFLLLVGYGQSLNVGIFRTIGHVGVYYGFKLGHHVPWVTGWPFDAVQHPQYVGSVLTVWGGIALLWGQVAHANLLLLGIYWTGLYVVTGLQEQYL